MADDSIPLSVVLAVQQFPPSTRDLIANAEGFASRVKLEATELISLGSEAHFDPDTFVSAIRQCFSLSSAVSALDNAEAKWEFKYDRSLVPPILTISNDEKTITCPDSRALSPIDKDRVQWLELCATSWVVRCPKVKSFLEEAKHRPLEFDEFRLLEDWRQENPVAFRIQLLQKFKDGLKASDLVPKSRTYFENFTSMPGAAAKMDEYLSGSFTDFCNSLRDWDCEIAVRHALRLASGATVLQSLGDAFVPEAQARALFAQEPGSVDLFSATALAEWALPKVESEPWLDPLLRAFLPKLLDQISDEVRLSLSSRLFSTADHLLVESKIFEGLPPSIRRQTAIAQSALIEETILDQGLDIGRMTEWLSGTQNENFFLQNLIDLVREPRWLAEYSTASQLGAEFAGRLLNAVLRVDESKLSPELREICLADEGSIKALTRIPESYFPGPLEGDIRKQGSVPSEIEALIEKALSDEDLSLLSFAPLINSASLAHISDQHANAAAAALRRVSHQIQPPPTDTDISSFMIGLAQVCAAARSTQLADELRVLSRVLRRTKAKGWGPEAEFMTLFIASAAEDQRPRWAERLGGWLTELAYETPAGENVEQIDSLLRKLWALAPDLRSSTTRADALFKAAAASA